MATIVYYGEFQHYGYCENWIAASLDRNGHHCIRLQRMKWFDEQRLIHIAKETNAAIVLLSKTPEITPDQLRGIKQCGLKVIFWTFDWMRHPDVWKWYGPLAKEADLCFQTDGLDANDDFFYAKEGIERIELHQGCEPLLHNLPSGVCDLGGVASDIMFIGSAYTQQRKDFIQHLASKHAIFKSFGDPGPQLWGRDFAYAVHFSSIVVGNNFVNDVPGYWSDRVYLTLACGGFFITSYVSGLENEFLNHRDLVWYHTIEELDDLIRHYRYKEKERRAIALNGYRLVHSRDTYDHRIQKMTPLLEALVQMP